MKRLGCVFCALTGLLLSTFAAAASAAPTFSIRRQATTFQGAYPGDFNNDGITDLATTVRADNGAPVPAVALGRGDGTFGTPIQAEVNGDVPVGLVFGTGDFNNDGHLDLIGFNTAGAPDEDIFIVAGRGDGTFDTARGTAVTLYQIRFVLSADFDDDGNRDIAVAEITEDGNDRLVLLRGHGDLTFDFPPATLSAIELTSGVAIDLNDDGLRDIAVTDYSDSNVTVYLNQGGMTFSPITVPVGYNAIGITAADVTGDGTRDLVVTSAGPDYSGGPGYGDGAVSVLAGHGDGTFAAATRYQVVRGAFSVVVTDVTRDGILDIVTANRSSIHVDDCSGSTLKTWDSLSVLTGAGDGTFGGPDNFSIGNQLNPLSDSDRNAVSSLLIADVNGDGATDLITSGGTIFVNHPSDPNWAPSVNLGPDQAYRGSIEVVLSAAANDVDQDMLAYSWTTDDGTVLPAVPSPCIGVGHRYGTFHYTVTVYDGHGHTASDTIAVTFEQVDEPSVTVQAPTGQETISAHATYQVRWHVHNPTGSIFTIKVYYSPDEYFHDTLATGCEHVSTDLTAEEDMSCTWSVPGPATNNAHLLFRAVDDDDMEVTGTVAGPLIIRDPTGALLEPWQHQDVGAVSAAGSATYVDGVYTVTGSGADIWGTADEFHYVFRPNPSSTGDVELITHVDSVQNVNAWTKAGLMVRTSLDPSAIHASLFVSPGKGIAFQRRVAAGGTSVHTAGPAITAPVWLRLTVRGGCTPACPGTVVRAYYRKNVTDPWVFLGEQDYTGPQSQFANVGLAVSSHVDGTTATAQFSAVSAIEKPNFAVAAIGTTNASANLATDDSWTLSAAGADIWGYDDQFLYAYTWTRSQAITARVKSLTNTNAWSKAGVMYREASSTNAAYITVVVTPGKGVAMQYRQRTGYTSQQVAQVLGVTAPVWVRLARNGPTFTGTYSTDGVTWMTIGSVDVDFLQDAAAGVALTSHTTAARATAVFENVYVEP
jgi:hypothetical protein